MFPPILHMDFNPIIYPLNYDKKKIIESVYAMQKVCTEMENPLGSRLRHTNFPFPTISNDYQ